MNCVLLICVCSLLGLLVAAQNEIKVRRQVVFPDDEDQSVDTGLVKPSEEEEPEPEGFPCLGPDRQRGFCVEYDRCPRLVGARVNFSVLRQYLCGFSGQVPKVCCPEKRVQQTPKPVTVPTARPATPTPRPPSPTPRPASPTPRPVPSRRPPIAPTPPIRRPLPATPRPEPSTLSPLEDTNRPRQLPRDCGLSNVTGTRIVGGQEAQVGAWPWLAAIYFEEQGVKTAECGGALISKDYVVTAAHCIFGDNGQLLPPREITVRLGDHDLFSTDDEAEHVDIDVDRIIPHAQFDRRTFHNDIAILVLKRSAQFTKFVQPICLAYDPPMLTDNYERRRAVVAGWGTTSFNGPSSSKLREVAFPVWNQSKCREAYRNDIPLNEDYMCAGIADGGKDACQGDSGGPLMLAGGSESRYHLIGVVSFGKRCAMPNFPGVYTNVRRYLNWIAENTR